MRFCPECENLLIIRGKKLYCKACNSYFEIPSDFQNDSVLVKNINHSEREFEPVIIENKLEDNHISNEYRKAYEEYFPSEEY